jgi:hypothetical protein
MHEHYDFVNGEDRDDGVVCASSRARRKPAPHRRSYTLRAGLKLCRPGYVACGACAGEPFSGALSDAVFSY